MNKIKLNNKTKISLSLASLALALLIIAGALIWKNNYQPSADTQTKPQRRIGQAELSGATGQFGKECLVAIEGIVYKIEDSSLWKNGEHTTSEGQAHCGADLTEVLKKSPHGKSKLEQLEKVGTLDQ